MYQVCMVCEYFATQLVYTVGVFREISTNTQDPHIILREDIEAWLDRGPVYCSVSRFVAIAHLPATAASGPGLQPHKALQDTTAVAGQLNIL